MWAQVSFVLSQCTRLTDRQTERSWQYRALHYMQSHGENTKVIPLQAYKCCRREGDIGSAIVDW